MGRGKGLFGEGWRGNVGRGKWLVGGWGGEGLTMQAKINVESQVKPVQERSRLE